jgi:4a-hydroxytetrahydrobiopterin dehydratase
MWQEENKSLVKEFSFSDFSEALTFVNKVGELAEAANHHPDIHLGWGKVVISLTTHDEGSVTEKDRQLAKEIDEIKE